MILHMVKSEEFITIPLSLLKDNGITQKEIICYLQLLSKTKRAIEKLCDSKDFVNSLSGLRKKGWVNYDSNFTIIQVYGYKRQTSQVTLFTKENQGSKMGVAKLKLETFEGVKNQCIELGIDFERARAEVLNWIQRKDKRLTPLQVEGYIIKFGLEQKESHDLSTDDLIEYSLRNE